MASGIPGKIAQRGLYGGAKMSSREGGAMVAKKIFFFEESPGFREGKAAG